MELQSYAKVLKGKDKGVAVEFVNPKYEVGKRSHSNLTCVRLAGADVCKLSSHMLHHFNLP